MSEYDGQTYRPKYHEDLVHSEISLPPNAPKEYADRATLWNAVELSEKSFYERTGLRTVDILSGGFPCQPFSTAGKRRGREDDRYLWPEMLRVIAEIKPTWVIGENVAGIINMALDTVLADLESQSYEARTIVLPACGVNAPHITSPLEAALAGEEFQEAEPADSIEETETEDN